MSGALQAVYQNQRSFAPPNFITTQKGAGTTTATGTKATQLTVDSLGNSYYVLSFGAANGSAGGGVVSKISSTGATVWTISLTNPSTSYCCSTVLPTSGMCGTVDSSGNFYLVTQTIDSNLFGGWNTAKFNSSGVLQWQRQVGVASNTYPKKVQTDASGNVYIFGPAGSCAVVKYNSSGTRQWQKSIGGWFASAGDMYVDSAGNVYLAGADAGVCCTGGYGAICIKLDTSGTVLGFSNIFQATGSLPSVFPTAINVDSNGDIYISAQYTASSVYSTLVLKLNSSFALQWGKLAVGGGVITPGGAYAVSFDSSNNVYVAAGNFTKYNSSGTVQLQRSITEYSLIQSFKGTQNLQTNMYLATSTGGANGYGGVNYALPNDGSKTGTYTVGTSTLIYAASSQTISNYTSATKAGRAIVANISPVSFVDSAGTGTANTVTTTNVTLTI